MYKFVVVTDRDRASGFRLAGVDVLDGHGRAKDRLLAGQALQVDHIGHCQVVFQLLHLAVQEGLPFLGRRVFRVLGQIAVGARLRDRSGDGRLHVRSP